MTINPTGQPLVNRLYDAIAQFPEGLTCAELYDLFPDEGYKNAVFAAISAMAKCGVLKRHGERTSPKSGRLVSVYITAKPMSEFRWITGGAKSKGNVRNLPTPPAIAARLDEANATIATLEAWKADAIKRFPDLAVDPAIITARKKVAALYRADGDNMKASAVIAGQHDHTPIMRAVASVIEDMAA